MSEINDFARDLVKRQIDVYNEYKSKKYDMTQPLSVLICCSIIIFSDYIENNGKNSLIEEIKKNDKDCELKQLIYDIYGDYFNKRVEKYCKDKIKNENNEKEFINEELNEYEVFFHDLRNEFAHLIETNKSEMEAEGDKNFDRISISHSNKKIYITKEQINKLIKIIDII